jgi:hypothetical protein
MNRQIQQWRVGVNKSKMYSQVQNHLKQKLQDKQKPEKQTKSAESYCRANNEVSRLLMSMFTQRNNSQDMVYLSKIAVTILR